ncbi:transposase [Patescibacteria group bacterium]|nr:transposase [Patescibacteria group bacterium]MBU1890058.1 transposase [Patescibacteria group bacterium]
MTGIIHPVFFYLTQRAFYQNEYPYFVTTNVSYHRWAFDDIGKAGKLASVVFRACKLKRFDLISFCILPEYVHLLVKKHEYHTIGECALERAHCGGGNGVLSVTPQSGLSSPRCGKDGHAPTLSDLMQSIKGTFSRSIGCGRFWQPRFYYQIVNTDQRLYNTQKYIKNNYQKHDLSKKYSKYPYVYLDKDILRELS